MSCVRPKDVIKELFEMEDQNLKVIERINLDGESIQEAKQARYQAIKRGKSEVSALKEQGRASKLIKLSFLIGVTHDSKVLPYEKR